MCRSRQSAGWPGLRHATGTPTNETTRSLTLAEVPGSRLTHTPVYVLTSARTFSGGEEFAYNLKHLQRATLVGETTAGAAHLIDKRRLDELFVIRVPTGRPINPITGTSWEVVGVEPDVRTHANDALRVAHGLARARAGRS